MAGISKLILKRRYARICVAVIIPLVIFTLLLHSQYLTFQAWNKYTFLSPLAPEEIPSEICELNLTTLVPYDLTSRIRYARRYIYTHPTHERLAHVASINEALLPTPQIVLRAATDHAASNLLPLLNCNRDPLRLAVSPDPPFTNTSRILFGVATTAERLKDALLQMQHWLSDGRASLLAVVPDSPVVHEVRAKMAAWGIDGTIKVEDADFCSRYFNLVGHLHTELHAERHRRPDIKWVAFIDDDTFFPSMSDVIVRLGDYDASKAQYIGGISEDFHQISKHGLFAFGGAGIFLSLPLLEELHTLFPACVESEKNVADGDVRLVNCIYKHTRTKLQIESGLHQMDFTGEMHGVFESGQRLLSIHHWKTWYKLDVLKLTTASDVCGEHCLLQRWRFTGQSSEMVLTNGYSLVDYPKGVPDLMETEKTWNANPDHLGEHRTLADDQADFAHSLAPLRRKLTEGVERITWNLVDAVREQEGAVRHVYVRKDDDREGGEDSVVELIWRKDPGYSHGPMVEENSR